MHKIWIVLKSEYLRRVRSKGFIITTLLLPLALVVFLAVIVFLTASAFEDEEAKTIAVVDETGLLMERLVAAPSERYRFEAATLPEDSLRAAVIAGRYSGYLVLPAGLVAGEGAATYYARESGGSIFEDRLDALVEGAVEGQRLLEANVAPEVLERLNQNVPLRTVKLTEEGEEAGNTAIFAVLGFGMGFLIFMMMVIYGSVVMQGVIDEKSSRVVEVIVSSVRPFHLMMGKVLGIGAMGLTQMVAWSALMMGATLLAGPLLVLFLDPGQMNLPDTADTEQILAAANITIPAISPWLFVWFVLFFLLGYLLYASIYAAVGSLVESQQESQSLLFPLLLPVLIAMYTLVPQVESPHSALSVTLSLLPFTSPISMVVRMAVTDVPLWQVALSVLLLAGAFLGAVWLGARIYRVGILMHGKRPSLKEIVRMVRYA